VAALTAEFQVRDAYHQAYEFAAQQLLRCNVQRLIPFRLKFDFNMYEHPANNEMRSLEHIHSQSRFTDSAPGETDGGGADEEAIGARVGNSIGNLVLLPKGLNCSLKDKGFPEKRTAVQQALLGGETKHANMALWLHSLEIFIAHQKWGAAEIESNNQAFLDDLKKFYGGVGGHS
jgi:hypothetical protein